MISSALYIPRDNENVREAVEKVMEEFGDDGLNLFEYTGHYIKVRAAEFGEETDYIAFLEEKE